MLLNNECDWADCDPDLLARVGRGMANAFDRQKMEVPQSRQRFAGLLDWGQYYLGEHFSCAPSKMHRWIAEQCDQSNQKRGARFNLLGPRGGAKSTLVALAHTLESGLEGRDMLIWFVGNTAEDAKKNLRNIKKEITDNALIRRDYPQECNHGEPWSAKAIRLGNGVQFEAYGLGNAIRGTRHGANRPTLIICDDLQSDAAMYSALRRDKEWRWLTGALLKSGEPRTNFFNLATALHLEAVALRLCRTPGWKSGRFPAIEQWPARMDLWEQWSDIFSEQRETAEDDAQRFYEANREQMEAGAVVLWPERESLLALMKQRVADGRNEFEREMQTRPINAEQCEWPEKLFDDHIWFDEWPASWQVRTMALDPSKGKDAKRSDYSAFAQLQVTDGILYFDVDMTRRTTGQMTQDGVRLYQKFRPDAFGLEANAFQELLADDYHREFAAAGMVAPDPYLIQNSVNKLVRIRKLGPYLDQKRIRFKRGSAGAMLAIGQLRDFPDPHSHDDGPDAMEMAERLAGQLLLVSQQDDNAFSRT